MVFTSVPILGAKTISATLVCIKEASSLQCSKRESRLLSTTSWRFNMQHYVLYVTESAFPFKAKAPELFQSLIWRRPMYSDQEI